MAPATIPFPPAGAVAIAPFTAAHLPGALALSQDLAWPYRLEDWAFALRLGQGFVLQSGGMVAGTAAWFPQGETHATVGLVIVSAALRGLGHGGRLMDAVLDAAGPRGLILNSTIEGRTLYERRGFRAVGTVHQHQGVVTGGHAAPAQSAVRAVRPSDRDTLARLDADATGLARGPLLQSLLEVGDAWVLLRGGRPAGYAVSRPFGRGHVVGPVVARTAQGARHLIEAALVPLAGRFVRIDTAAGSEAGTDLSPWLEAIGLPRIGDALAMVRGAPPALGEARVFALASQSLN